jgi:hypothetical protein
MYGQLTYDADGNLVASLKLYTADDAAQPELARLTVADQVHLLDEYGDGDEIPSYEELNAVDADELAAEAAFQLSARITQATGLKPYVNPGNGHADLKSAVSRAFTPGGPGPLGFTFRITG